MEIERLKFCIGRYDHYYDSVNNKSNVLLALGVFVTGGLVALYPFIADNVTCTIYVHLMLGAEIGLGLATVLITKTATTPYLRSDTDSLHYFGSVAQLSIQQFSTLSEQMTQDQEITDLRCQVSALAKGLAIKFTRLRLASILIVIQFALFLPFLILLLINIKK
ncbi:Pycsar system effector family protein [Pedobacter sp.]